MNNIKMYFFGGDDTFGLCPSYLRSAKKLNYEVELFDFDREFAQNVRFGKFGKLLSTYLTVDAWVHKTNRKFIVRAMKMQPDLILVYTNYYITPGALLFLRSVLPKTKFILMWPDSLANIKQHVFASAPLYDAVASLSSNSLSHFENIGFKKAFWLPLAGDPSIHSADPTEEFDYDVSFVGGWRPERETAMKKKKKNFPGKKIIIHGADWKRFCKDKSLLSLCSGRWLFGKEMANCFSRSRVNINVIDDTNYPAANMRFFEIPTAGGLELVSACPEMENIFRNRNEVLYFSDEKTLIENIQFVFDHPEEAKKIRARAKELINREHNYDLRLQSILKYCEQI